MSDDRMTVGNVKIVSLLDTPIKLAWRGFFPNNEPADFERYRESFPGSYAGDDFQTYSHCYAIISEGRTILCDAGLGPGPLEAMGVTGGRLLEEMRTKGLQPESVDLVAFTHLHRDHTGWAVREDGSPTFPNARYLIPQEDWDHFSGALDANPHMQALLPLEGMGVFDLFSGERPVTGELTTYPTPGHTPGHTSLLVSSLGEKAIITGDLAHHPAQVERTEWCSAFDEDAGRAIETRRRVFDQLEADGVPAAVCHFPDTGFGRITRLQGRRFWRAI